MTARPRLHIGLLFIGRSAYVHETIIIRFFRGIGIRPKVSRPMELNASRNDVRDLVRRARARGSRIGVVPTMGALHEGHLSLVRASASECEFTVVTIFVNPTQFGPGEDFERYPRDLQADLDLLETCGVDLVFAPTVEELYSPDHSTYVQPPRVAAQLEGEFRPHHFQGVATIVLKLFQIVPADAAFFGQKDYQQCLVVQHMAEELDVPVAIRICPIVREADGLALSSRNAYLSTDERHRALALSRSLQKAVAMFRDGETNSQKIEVEMREMLKQAGVTRVDYVALADPNTLAKVAKAEPTTMALVAAHVGRTRLIDNTRLG